MFSVLSVKNVIETRGPRRGQGVVRVELVKAEVFDKTIADIVRMLKKGNKPFHAIVFEGNDSLAQINSTAGHDLLDALKSVFNVPIVIESNTTSFTANVFIKQNHDLSFTHIIDIKPNWLNFFLDRSVGESLYNIYKNVNSYCLVKFALPENMSSNDCTIHFNEIQRFIEAFNLQVTDTLVEYPISDLENSEQIYNECLSRGLVLDTQ